VLTNPPIEPPRWRAAWLLALGGVLLVLLLASVHRFLALSDDRGEPGLVVAPLHDGKLFVLLVDGMRPEDAEDPRLSFLEPMRANGFSADVQPCMEALTVPCVNEAFTGTATAGLLGAYQNLVDAGEIASTSLFSDVAQSGRTVAVYHGGQYKAFARWFSDQKSWGRTSEPKEEQQAFDRFVAAGHDLIVFHYPHLDEAAHHHRVGSEGYQAALDLLDADATRMITALPPEYEVVVLGDHGHTNNGRHIYGLDIPTRYYASGRTFGPGAVEGRVPITTYRYLLGAELGILPPLQYEGADLFARLPAGTALRAAAEGRAYTGVRPEGVLPVEVIVVAVLAALAALVLAPRRVRPWLAVGLVAAAVAGVAYLDAIPRIHYNPDFRYVKWRIAGAVLALGALGMLFRRRAGGLVAAVGMAAVLVPGTVYDYGLFENLPHFLLLVVLAVTVVPRLRGGGWRGLAPLVGLLIVGWLPIADVDVGTFRIRQFPHLEWLHNGTNPVAWAVLAGAFARGGWRTRVASGLVAGIGAGADLVDGGLPLAALTIAVVVAALRAPWVLPVVAGWVVVPWYGYSNAIGVASCVLFAIACARLADGVPAARPWLPGLAAIALAYLGFALSTGLRANGMDFNFAIAWLPEDQHLRYWPVIAAAMLVKIALPAVLVAQAVRRFGGDPPLAHASAIAFLARLAGSAAFLAGFLLHTADPPRYRLLELLEDSIAVWFAALVVGGVAAQRGAWFVGAGGTEAPAWWGREWPSLRGERAVPTEAAQPEARRKAT
jgi:hypothetical protein